MNAADIAMYADRVMVLVDEDIESGQVPADVATFSDLHSHVDANEYLIQTDVPYDMNDLVMINAVSDEVSRRLTVRVLEGDEGIPQCIGRRRVGGVAKTVRCANVARRGGEYCSVCGR